MKKITFAAKPTQTSRSADEWVANRPVATEPTKRLTLDISLSLHRRIKLGCAVEEVRMTDVIRELLERRFPEEYDREGGTGGNSAPSAHSNMSDDVNAG